MVVSHAVPAKSQKVTFAFWFVSELYCMHNRWLWSPYSVHTLNIPSISSHVIHMSPESFQRIKYSSSSFFKVSWLKFHFHLNKHIQRSKNITKSYLRLRLAVHSTCFIVTMSQNQNKAVRHSISCQCSTQHMHDLFWIPCIVLSSIVPKSLTSNL
jgi:hypothetical protein